MKVEAGLVWEGCQGLVDSCTEYYFCMYGMFNCLPVADVIARCRSNFLLKFSQSNNVLCEIGCSAVPTVSVSVS